MRRYERWMIAGLCILLPSMAWGASAFLATQVVTADSPKNPDGGIFEVFFTHRFSQTIADSDLNNLFGLDSFAYTGLGLAYGVSDTWSLALYRTANEKNFEATLRWQWLSADDGIADLVIRGSLNFNTDPGTNDPLRLGLEVIAGVHVGPLSLMAAPAYMTNPARVSGEDPFTFGIILGVSVRVLETVSIVAEAVPVLSGYRLRDVQGTYHPTWGAGVQIEVGGHVFTLLVTNQVGTTLDQFLPGAPTSSPRLGFNLVRRF